MPDPFDPHRLDLVAVQNRIEDALADVRECFVDGMRLTFIARHPDIPHSHVIVTADDLGELVALLELERGFAPDPPADPRSVLEARVRAFCRGGDDDA